MSAEDVKLQSMSLDELWSLHEKISAILATRIEAEKLELEKRLAVLRRGVGTPRDAVAGGQDVKLRRKYPAVLPKYRNPKTAETWSGRGKLPRWLVAAKKAGKKIEEFRIGVSSAPARRRADAR